jgi:hypothetical protein
MFLKAPCPKVINGRMSEWEMLGLDFQGLVEDGAFFAGQAEPEALTFAGVFFVGDRGGHEAEG